MQISRLTSFARHYSYECKASTQERPYTTRPSRTQQLRDPKLVPKFTHDTLQPVEKRKGVADDELAKAEAERARQRELEKREDDMIAEASRRRRSVSSASVSTISTNSSTDGFSRKVSSRKGPHSPSPQRRRRSPSSGSQRSSHRSYIRSPSPPRRRQERSFSRSSQSPRREVDARSYRERGRKPAGRKRSMSPEEKRSYPRESRNATDVRRPQRQAPGSPDPRDDFERNQRPGERGPRRGEARRERGDVQRRMPAEQAPRERSLSPFSKRLALTQSLNKGR